MAYTRTWIPPRLIYAGDTNRYVQTEFGRCFLFNLFPNWRKKRTSHSRGEVVLGKKAPLIVRCYMSRKSDRLKTTKWYDGFLYSKFITPFEVEIMNLVDELIPIDSIVIDIGCGAGSLVLKLSTKCKKVTGVDISNRMIAYANTQKEKMQATNVTFVCEDISTMGTIHDEQFSFAIVCLCLHGISWKTRQDVIKNCFSFSQRVILADFISPFPKGIVGTGQILLEIIEGRESFRNFKEWQRKGGIDGFIEQMGLSVIEERRWSNGFGKTNLVSE
jgi:SAM-dependent methyltransferase